MKLIYRLLFLTLIISSCSVTQTKVTHKSFPTNFTGTDLKYLETRNGDIIAFNGKIIEKNISRNSTPVYLLELNEDKSIWTVLMFKTKGNKIGDQIRVVGYLTEIKDKRPDENYLGNEKYMVLAMGLVDKKKR